jgi:assimilatory nitrate reductase catalytic subunit
VAPPGDAAFSELLKRKQRPAMSYSSLFTETETISETITAETRQQRLTRTGQATPRFLQGVFPFAGRGFFDLGPLNDALTYQVPPGRTAEVIYFRAGNLSDDLLYLALSVNGRPVRYFPVGPKADFHVPLSIIETHPAGSRIEIGLAAPRGLTGTIVVDVGILEEHEAA